MPHGLVIGGGVVGLSLAYELSGRGWQVTVLDRRAMGREASWAGAGILPPANRQSAQHPLDLLRALSAELHAAWASQLRDDSGIDTGYRRCGGIYLAQSSGEAAALHGQASLLRDEHVVVERLTDAALAALEPALAEAVSAGRIKAAYHLPDEAQLRNPRHLQALVQACRRRGVTLREHTEAIGFVTAGGRVVAIRTPREELAADRFCVTTGAWTKRLLAELQVDNGTLPIRGQMVLFRATTPPLRKIISDGPRYLVARDDGYLLAGSTEEDVGFDQHTSPEAIDELTLFATALVPALRAATVERTWAGLRPATYDGFPYLGPIPGIDNGFVAAGHFRSGLYLSPATAVVMACLMENRPPPIDLTPFRVGRG